MGILDRAAQRVLGYDCVYLGGHPGVDRSCRGKLYVRNDSIVFESLFGRSFELPYRQLSGVSVETEKSVSTMKTLAKWMVSPAWGMVSGLKGSKVLILKVTFKDETGFESDVLFQCAMAHEVRARIVSERHKSLAGG